MSKLDSSKPKVLRRVEFFLSEEDAEKVRKIAALQQVECDYFVSEIVRRFLNGKFLDRERFHKQIALAFVDENRSFSDLDPEELFDYNDIRNEIEALKIEAERVSVDAFDEVNRNDPRKVGRIGI